MAEILECVKGKIVDYDERTRELVIRAPYDDYQTLVRREYKTVDVKLIDGRPLSSQQRRMCYAMLREISAWSGYSPEETKRLMKIRFCAWSTADALFSLSDAPMSVVAEFQRFLIEFIVENDIPTKVRLIEYVDDIESYVYACLAAKKCAVCGGRAELHHVDRVGMGRDRDDIIHEGMAVLPLCREHHTEAHGVPDAEFLERYHLVSVPADKSICKIYKLGRRKNA